MEVPAGKSIDGAHACYRHKNTITLSMASPQMSTRKAKCVLVFTDESDCCNFAPQPLARTDICLSSGLTDFAL
jgi:hypothetical protein